MRLFEVTQLLEYNQQATLNKWGERIAKAATFNEQHLNDQWFYANNSEIVVNNDEDLALAVLKELESIDPTPNKQYVMTLIRWYTAVVKVHDQNKKLYAKLKKAEDEYADDWEPGENEIWPDDYRDLGTSDYVSAGYVSDRASEDWNIEGVDFDIQNMDGRSTFKLEDAEQIRDALENFESIKPQLPANERDIGRFKSFHRFEDFVDNAYDENYVPPVIDNKTLERSDVEVLYNGPLGTVTIPKSHEASCALGSGTKWCTTGKNSYFYDSYSSKGDLIIYNEKPGNAKYQLHVTINGLEARDARDRLLPVVKEREFTHEHPVISKIIQAQREKIFATMAQQPWTTDAITNDGGDPTQLVRQFINFNNKHQGGVMRYVDEYYVKFALPSILNSKVTIPSREFVVLMLTYAKQRGKPWPEMMALMMQILRKAAESADLSSNVELKSINRLVAQLDTVGNNPELEQFKADVIAKLKASQVGERDINSNMNEMRRLINLVESAQLNELMVRLSSDKKFQRSDTYKNYLLYVTKEKFKDRYYISKAAHSNGETFKAGGSDVKASGASQLEALDNLRDAIDELLNAQKVTRGAMIDFNVQFVQQLLVDPLIPFYAHFDNIGGEPVLVIAGDDMTEFGDELRQLGFKRSAIRTNPGDELSTATPLPSISYTAKQIAPAGLIANARYIIGDSHSDSDGNTIYELTYHSTVHTASDKRYLNVPALTVGTARI
jgi:hypothetical protein